MNLKGKSAIVTGGGSGVGKATCIALAKLGVKVGIFGRTFAKCESVANEINKNGGVAIPLKGDVANSKDVNSAIETLVKEFSSVDILINSAGVCSQKRLLDSTENEFDLIMDSNVKGTYLFTKAAYAFMKKQNNGHIINISSGASGWPGANEIIYGTAKTAQTKLTMHTKFEFDLENKIRDNNNLPKGEFFPLPVTIAILVNDALSASSTPYCNNGLVKTGSISFGIALVAGKNLVPYPAAGNRHFLICDIYIPNHKLLFLLLYPKFIYFSMWVCYNFFKKCFVILF